MNRQCAATTKRGTHCKNLALGESPYCGVHAHSDTLAEATEVLPRGGRSVKVAEREPAQPVPDKHGNAAFVSTGADDPFQAIAAAMQQAAQDVNLDEVPTSPPHVDRTGVSKAIYSTAYCVGFGAAFPACLVMNLLPAEGAVARGLRDGAADAANRLNQKK